MSLNNCNSSVSQGCGSLVNTAKINTTYTGMGNQLKFIPPESELESVAMLQVLFLPAILNLYRFDLFCF